MRRFRTSLTIVIAVLSLGSCSNQGGQSSAPLNQGTQAALSNPTDFPLMGNAKVLDAKPFKQVVSGDKASGLLSSGAGTYAGTEVLAGTTVLPSDVHVWLASIEQSPPNGYAYQPQAQVASMTPVLSKYGIEYAVFKHSDPTKKGGAVVVIMDPKVVQSKLGFALSLVDKYRMLPAAMRNPIDERLKSRTGFSATEATDPSAPIGMTLAALKEIHASGERAIILVDAAKQ